jgi:hypothetical protein
MTTHAPAGTSTRGTGRPSSSTPALALSAGVAAGALAVYQVATPGSPQPTFETFADWLREGLFVAYLAASMGAVLGAHRRALAPRFAAWSIGLGYGAVLLAVLYGMLTKDDPDWFFVIAGPGNLLAITGFVVWAVWGYRTRNLPPWAALLCGVGGLTAVLLAELGTSVLVAGFWFFLAARTRS